VELTPQVAGLVALAGAVAGAVGALLGIGGGVLLVPILVLGVQLPMHLAVGVSLTTVIATSSAVSAATAGRQLINLRLGILLEVATAAGGLLGGLTAQAMSARTLTYLFSAVTGAVAVVTALRVDRRNILDASADPGELGGRIYDEDTKRLVAYRVTRLPLALFGSFLAGQLSTLLGIGGGTLKVPLLNAWCGVPLRVAAATSALMIGVTAASGAIVYYGQGLLLPGHAAAAVLGVSAGSTLGMRFGIRSKVRNLKITLALILIAVSISMLLRRP
jgi:uncharacterized membrane protein YfcA